MRSVSPGLAHAPSRLAGPWWILAAAILWGTTGTAQALAPSGAQPAVVGALRLLIGGVALLIFAVARGTLRSGRPWPLLATLLAAGCIAAYQLSFFAGVARTGVALGTLVGIGSAPILAGGLSVLFGAGRPDARWVLATFLAIAGCSLLLWSRTELEVDRTGILLAVAAGAAYAAYTLSSKALLAAQPPEAVVAVTFSLGALLLSPLLLAGQLSWVGEARGLAVVLHLGLVATALAYTLFARGLLEVPAATAVTLSLGEPLTAGALGVFVLGEQLTFTGLVGVALLFGGLLLLSMKPARA